jgi:hypothetical protein
VGWEWHAELAGAGLVPTLVKPERWILVGHESGVGGDNTLSTKHTPVPRTAWPCRPQMRQRWRSRRWP